MKLNCGMSPAERREKMADDLQVKAIAMRGWHDVFAWLPIRVGEDDCRWLEYVERRFPSAGVAAYPPDVPLNPFIYEGKVEYRGKDKL